MLRMLKSIFENIANFFAGITFTLGLSAIFLIAGVAGSIMALFGFNEPLPHLQVRRGVVNA